MTLDDNRGLDMPELRRESSVSLVEQHPDGL
jgi:hypothetical protein